MAEANSFKIVHVAETIRGGIATYINELHGHQAASFGAENIHYVIPEDHRGDLAGIAHERIIGFRRDGRDPGSLARMAAATMACIREHRPDVVHLHSTFAGLILRPWLKLWSPRTRIVYCPHGWAFARETSRLSHVVTKAVERMLVPLCERIVCISASEHAVAIAAGLPADKLALVRSGISAERPQVTPAAWDDARTKILFIGRLDRQKGYDLLLEAARRLEGKVHVRMIGSAVVGESQEIDVPPNVEMLGWQSRGAIEAQLEAADVAIVPSRWEGFGLVALEAMRARKAVIAFAVGALPEIVEDNVTGFLCSPVSVDSLVSTLQRSTEAPLEKMGQSGHQRFRKHFSVETMHRLLNSVYGDVLASSFPERDRSFSEVK